MLLERGQGSTFRQLLLDIAPKPKPVVVQHKRNKPSVPVVSTIKLKPPPKVATKAPLIPPARTERVRLEETSPLSTKISTVLTNLQKTTPTPVTQAARTEVRKTSTRQEPRKPIVHPPMKKIHIGKLGSETSYRKELLQDVRLTTVVRHAPPLLRPERPTQTKTQPAIKKPPPTKTQPKPPHTALTQQRRTERPTVHVVRTATKPTPKPAPTRQKRTERPTIARTTNPVQKPAPTQQKRTEHPTIARRTNPVPKPAPPQQRTVAPSKVPRVKPKAKLPSPTKTRTQAPPKPIPKPVPVVTNRPRIRITGRQKKPQTKVRPQVKHPDPPQPKPKPPPRPKPKPQHKPLPTKAPPHNPPSKTVLPFVKVQTPPNTRVQNPRPIRKRSPTRNVGGRRKPGQRRSISVPRRKRRSISVPPRPARKRHRQSEEKEEIEPDIDTGTDSDDEKVAVNHSPAVYTAPRVRGTRARRPTRTREPTWKVHMKPRLEVEQIDTKTLVFRVRGGIDKSIRNQVVLALRRKKGKIKVEGTLLEKSKAIARIMSLLKQKNSATVGF